jgi:hypothetical protein
MQHKFRALRIISTVYKILAWIMFVGGALAALLVVIVGVLQGRRGAPSAMMGMVPGAAQIVGPLAGVLAGIGLLIGALVLFVLMYAAAEVIDLGLSVEQNTREMALYLKGESVLPAPPAPISWETPLEGQDRT